HGDPRTRLTRRVPLSGPRRKGELLGLDSGFRRRRVFRDAAVADPPYGRSSSLAACPGCEEPRNRSDRPATPSATFTPTWATNDTGCSITARRVPPMSAFAPPPTPRVASPLSPTYLPASAPRRRPRVRVTTAHDITPPAVAPTSSPNRVTEPA